MEVTTAAAQIKSLALATCLAGGAARSKVLLHHRSSDQQCSSRQRSPGILWWGSRCEQCMGTPECCSTPCAGNSPSDVASALDLACWWAHADLTVCSCLWSQQTMTGTKEVGKMERSTAQADSSSWIRDNCLKASGWQMYQNAGLWSTSAEMQLLPPPSIQSQR